MIPTVAVTRYVTPLREGGSLPGIVEGDDLGTYVCKFRGAGQGVRVLVAEVIVGELARRIGLNTPRLVALELDPEIARYEADEEVQDLLNASPGLNLGVDFLPGAFGYDGELPGGTVDAAKVVWLDALCANVDRSWRNPNLLVWHGGALGDRPRRLPLLPPRVGRRDRRSARSSRPSRGTRPTTCCSTRPRASARSTPSSPPCSTRRRSTEVLALVPDAWLEPVPGAETPEAQRAAYVEFLTRPAAHPRLASARRWPDDEAVLPVRRAPLRAARRPRGVHQRRGGALLPGRRLPRRALARRPRPAAGLRPARSTSTRCATRWRSSTASARATTRGGAAAREPIGQRFGFLKAPRSTMIQPGPVHGGVTTDPARQLEHLLERFVS